MATRGGIGTIGHLIRSAPFYFKKLVLSQAFLQRSERPSTGADEFDSQYMGIDTGGIIQLSNLKVTDADWKFGHGYQAILPQEFTLIFQALELDFSRFVFIDIGSGKGRALLLAAAYPFKAIIGVELVEELHAIAEKNIGLFPDSKKVCKNLSSICRNALSFQLPAQPLIIFMYNPFTEQVLQQFISNVIQSVTALPRDIYLFYCNDRYSEVLESAGLTAIQSGNSAGDSWGIYKVFTGQ